MNRQIHQMMPACPGAKNLIVELVSNPGHRMGVASMRGRKSPLYVRPVQTMEDVFVFRNVGIVVVVDEFVRVDGPVNHTGNKGQRQANEWNSPRVW